MGLAQMVLAYLEIRPSGSKPAKRLNGGVPLPCRAGKILHLEPEKLFLMHICGKDDYNMIFLQIAKGQHDNIKL